MVEETKDLVRLGFFEHLWKGDRFTLGTLVRLGLFATLAVALSIFHLWTSYFGILEAWLHRAIHLGFVLMLVYLLPSGPLRKDEKGRLYAPFRKMDIVLFLLSAGILVYAYVDYFEIIMREGIPNANDKIVSTVLIILIIEASRRMCGFPIALISSLLVFYALFGYLIPGLLGIPGYSYEKFTDQMFNSIAGIFSIPMGAAAVYIVIFIIFGAFLLRTQAGEFFIKLAVAVAGHLRGGPAKVAVIASALMGTIHGSGPGNVATTGSFTIPLMKRIGYPAHFAGAVEAAASTGGIIMPPVMGATAFVIAEFTQVSYAKVCVVAAIPAILYFLAVYVTVHIEAIKNNLQPVPKEEIPGVWETLKGGGYMLLPIGAIIFFLAQGQSAMKAGFWAIVVIFFLSQVRQTTRMGPLSFLGACELGARNTLMISTACAAAGIIVGLISLTGLGVKLSALVVEASGGHMIFALIFTMIICIVLGMGMPVTPAYLITATTAALSLMKMGVDTLIVHLFIFYYATMSAITPPVALSSYTAAGIAQAPLGKTGWTAFKVALTGFIVPFMFVYGPPLLIGYGNWIRNVLAITTAIVGVFFLSAGIQGFLFQRANFIQRTLWVVGALLLIKPGWSTDLTGIFLVVLSSWYNRRWR